ncbi:MAG: transcriptional regulator, MerR family, partial [Clostridia bacterium]|nr:transcriptional regulator, MerR family [Clostridia bacterium]
RCANYSLAAILRMLQALSQDPQTNIRTAIDTPSAEEDIISVCDHLLTSLECAEENANKIYKVLLEMKKTYFFKPPLLHQT